MPTMQEIVDLALKESGEITPNDYAEWVRSTHTLGDFGKAMKTYEMYKKFQKSGEHDKYKHAMMNCEMAQGGIENAYAINEFARQKEKNDVKYNKNTQEASDEDMLANQLGMYLGIKNQKGNCDELVQKYISKKYQQ